MEEVLRLGWILASILALFSCAFLVYTLGRLGDAAGESHKKQLSLALLALVYVVLYGLLAASVAAKRFGV